MLHVGGATVVIAIVACVIGYLIGKTIRSGYGWLLGAPLVFLAVWLGAEYPESVTIAAGLGFLGVGIAFNPGSKSR